jgi:hypothetical protein
MGLRQQRESAATSHDGVVRVQAALRWERRGTTLVVPLEYHHHPLVAFSSGCFLLQ